MLLFFTLTVLTGGMVMSLVRHALQRLGGVVGDLEGSVAGLEQVLSGEQRDMFSSPSNENLSDDPPVFFAVGAAAAQRVDRAIEGVEKLLREG